MVFDNRRPCENRPSPFGYLFGKTGSMLWMFANGLDTSPVSNIGAKSMIKSIGNGTTAPRDLVSDEDIRITLMVLCESVSARLRKYGFVCRTVQISIRDNQLHWYSRQGQLDYPNRTAKSLFDLAFSLFKSIAPICRCGASACAPAGSRSENTNSFPSCPIFQPYKDRSSLTQPLIPFADVLDIFLSVAASC